MERCRPNPEEICCRLNLQSTPGQLGWGIVVDSVKALPEAHVMVPTQQSCTTYKEVWLRIETTVSALTDIYEPTRSSIHACARAVICMDTIFFEENGNGSQQSQCENSLTNMHPIQLKGLRVSLTRQPSRVERYEISV